MKITALYGSPRKNGNSSTIVNEFLRGAADGHDVTISKHFLYEETYGFCTACMGCKQEHNKECVLNDDMKQIYKDLETSDVIVFASPLHWWNISSKIKVLIDRLYCYIGTEKLYNKKMVVYITGISEIPNSGYDISEQMLKEIFGYLGPAVEVCPISADDTRPVAKNEAAMKAAYEKGKNIQ